MISVLETTKEEYFTPQQRVFVSVFSIKFSLAWYGGPAVQLPHS